MLKVYVDSGSSIKQDEKEKYQVEIVPLRYMMGEKECLDGIDITIDEFYELLIKQKLFPKTSLPNLVELEEKVAKDTGTGDDVIIITISSGISYQQEEPSFIFAVSHTFSSTADASFARPFSTRTK